MPPSPPRGDPLGGIFLALLSQLEREQGGPQVSGAQGALDDAGGATGFKERSGRRGAQGMKADASCGDAGPLFGVAEGSLDAASAQGRGGWGGGLVLSSRGGKEPEGVAVGLPVVSQEEPRVVGEGNRAVLGSLTAMDRDQRAVTIESGDLKGQACREAQPPGVDWGQREAVVQGAG